MGNTIKKHIQRNTAPHTKLQAPKGEEQQSLKAIGVIREKDSLPKKLENLA
jgi:hypothetical protein